jgi:Ca2+-binding RTX toxin-like protein
LNVQARLIAPTSGGDDLIYGGTGDDFIHCGAGDDAISGAEAQAAWFNDLPVGAQFYVAGGYVTNFNGTAVFPTNPLGYDAATRKLAAYDANNPLAKIKNFFLNFDAALASGIKIDDGKDRIFGDNGNDWLVGGTGNDRLFGGRGDDLMSADDNLETNGGLNNQPDAPQFADADFVYGGDGLDVMIANTGGDRMFDWSGEFNTYLVPYSPFGDPTVSRLPSPQIQAFLLALGQESGADPTLTEPNGELGLFTQRDPEWNKNKGGPRDPQAGNIGGTQRDTQGGPEDDRITALPLDLTQPALRPASARSSVTPPA